MAEITDYSQNPKSLTNQYFGFLNARLSHSGTRIFGQPAKIQTVANSLSNNIIFSLYRKSFGSLKAPQQ